MSPGQSDAARDRLLYRMPRHDGAVWLGLPLSALLVLAVTLAAAVAFVMTGGPLPFAALLLVAAGVSCLLPMAGRTLLGWIGPAVRHGLTVSTGRRGSTPATGRSPGAWRLPLPPECGPVTLAAAPDGSGQSGDPGSAWAVLQHGRRARGPHHGTRTLVLEVCHLDGVALPDPAGLDLRLAGWGGCLDALAADPRVHSLQWLTHSRPDTRDHQHRPESSSSVEPGAESAMDLRGDYDVMVQSVAAQALTHQHLLTVTLAGAGRDETAVVDVARDVASLLLTADLLARPLTAGEIGPLLRRLTDPTVHDTDLLGDPDDEDVQQSWGIRCRRSGWDHTRTDDSWHRSYTVSGWPRLPLPADWLAPLLQALPPAGTSRTVAVHTRPVAPVHAVRQARAAAAKAQLDATDRGRFGLNSGNPGAASAVDERAVQDAAELESELAAGFRLLQVRSVLTITAPTRALLEQATTALRTTAATSRIDLRPLHGQHQHGLVATLPLGLLPGQPS